MEPHLEREEAFLHVLWFYSSEVLHCFVETLAGPQLVLGPQRAFQKDQTHSEEDLHSWVEADENMTVCHILHFNLYITYIIVSIRRIYT